MRSLVLTPDAAGFVGDLDAKRFKQVVGKMFDLLRDPLPPDSQQMKGYEARRADIGEYRIVYRFDVSAVYVDLIGKRNDDDVYRRLKRR